MPYYEGYIDDTGHVGYQEYFVKLWNKYIKMFTDAPVRLMIRDFENINRTTMINLTLPVEEAVALGLCIEFGTRIYSFNLDLEQLLPRKAIRILKAGRVRKKGRDNIPARQFVAVGQTLSNLLGRRLDIDLRLGGGDINEIDSELYTFFPRKPVHKSVPGSWET